MIDLSDDSNLDIWEYLLKNEGSTKHRTTLNCDLIEMEERSVSENRYCEEVIDFGFDNVRLQKPEVQIEDNPPHLGKAPSQECMANQQKQDDSKEKEKSIILSNQESGGILRTRTIRKEGKKNTNLPKFLVRIFMKHKKKCETESGEIESDLKQRITNNFNMKDLLGVLGHNGEPS